MSEAQEMDNAIACVSEGLAVLVKGKEVTGSVCASGELHTGYQLAGIHSCDCKKPEVKKESKKSKKKG